MDGVGVRLTVQPEGDDRTQKLETVDYFYRRTIDLQRDGR